MIPVSKHALSFLFLLAPLAVGCSEPPAKGKDVSTVSGALVSATFPAVPTGVDATDEAGVISHTAADANGKFALSLSKGHRYRLAVVSAAGREPLVFPRASGKLDTTFKVGTGAARFDLGTVRHFASAPTSGFKAAQSGGEGEDGECVDGALQGSGEACVDDDDKATCEGSAAVEADDGECENGKDAKTGAACADEDDHEDGADGAKPMAIAENNVPQELGGCEDGAEDGEEADD